MKKKGFTLVELLAVIVILAIIAVIATPIILEVIETAKKGAAENSAKGYLDAVEKQIAINLLDNDTTNDIIDGDYTVGDLIQKGVSVKGDMPTYDSTLTIINNQVSKYILKIGDYTIDSEKEITKDEEQKVYKCKRATTLHTEECLQTSETSYCSGAGYVEGNKGTTITYGNLGTKGTLASGDAFDCDVNGDGTYDAETERFYYLSDYYNTGTNTFEEDKASLIYYSYTAKNSTDSNLIEYNNTSDLGPVTATTNLPTIEQWGNVNLINTKRYMLGYWHSIENAENVIEYDYNGYAARLVSLHELKNHCATVSEASLSLNLNICNFLMENTSYSNPNINNGYWIESPYNANYIYNIWSVSGEVVSDGAHPSTTLGYVRPVIEVRKTDIDY